MAKKGQAAANPIMTDAGVRAKTGRDWAYWFGALDKAGAAKLDHKEIVGVNPEVAHEHMPGLNMTHAVAQAWEAGKLFHIDLNDQVPGRYDQDLRFGSANPKAAFFLVKFLEDVGYEGSRHFDAHAYRTEDYEGVKDFARGRWDFGNGSFSFIQRHPFFAQRNQNRLA